jgi:Xaa-Pro aminopeptidase
VTVPVQATGGAPAAVTDRDLGARADVPARLDALRARVAELGGDAALLSAPADVRWASGFTTPEDAKVVVTQGAAVLITDSRYTVQAAEESAIEVRMIDGRTWLELAIELLAGSEPVVQADHLTWHAARALEEARGAPPVAAVDLTRPLRIVKTAREIACLREAARLTDAAFAHVLEGALRPGAREVDVALALARFVREQGGDGLAFEPIVAGGPRSAMPHGVASARVLERGDLVTLDFGAVVDGYHADMTRAVALGPVAEPLRTWFDLVLDAQRAAVAALRPGMAGVAADAVARALLAAAGIAARFAHSLGHGTGLQIHEGPSLSVRSKDVLAPGMIVTVEPGVYDAAVGGLRIEDLVLITDTGCEVLSHAPKDYLEL